MCFTAQPPIEPTVKTCLKSSPISASGRSGIFLSLIPANNTFWRCTENRCLVLRSSVKLRLSKIKTSRTLSRCFLISAKSLSLDYNVCYKLMRLKSAKVSGTNYYYIYYSPKTLNRSRTISTIGAFLFMAGSPSTTRKTRRRASA